MGRRVLFLSASVGDGHTAAARAVERALVALDPSAETETVDSYRYAASVFSKVVADGYIGMVKTVPQLYRFIYDRAERATHVPAFRRWVSTYTAANLRALIARRKPDVVVCTHAFPCGVMAEYKRTIDPTLPVAGIVTDFVVHPFWIYRNIDAYAVATPEMRGTLVSRGVDGERIVVAGIPVDPRFADRRLPVDALRSELGLPVDRPLVLLMAGGLGMARLDNLLRAFDRIGVPFAAVAIAGRNARLHKRIAEAATSIGYPLRVFGFVENVFDFMHASDVLVTKPGGLTASEALTADLPMVILRPLPGQEERNVRYLTSRKAAIAARSERQIVSAVERLLASVDERERLRHHARAIGNPHAAADVALRLLSL